MLHTSSDSQTDFLHGQRGQRALRHHQDSGSLSRRWVLELSFWPLQFGGWALFCLVPLGVWLTHAFTDPLLLWLFFIRPFSGFAITSALRPLCGWIVARRWGMVRLFLLALLASALLGAVELLASVLLGRLLGYHLSLPLDRGVWTGMFLMRSGLLFIWLILYFGLKNLRGSVELERKTRDAELQLLRSQVNPHFLFNALTTIMEVGRENPRVVALTQSLSNYLRFSLIQGKGHGEALHPLDEELEALRSYLEVEKVRFEEKLEYRFEVDEAARKALVPSALVQPLLENAIKYGQRTSPSPLRIRISDSMAEDESSAMLHLTVSNTGSWLEPHLANSLGTGTGNLRRRLQLIYGDAASLELSHADGLVTASVALPTRSPRGSGAHPSVSL